jgi:hypothetical protein
MRQLDQAADLAEEIGDDGAALELWQLCQQARRLLEQSIDGKRHRMRHELAFDTDRT